MKKQLLLILLLVLQSFIIFIPSSVTAPENPEGYVIEGDSVVWENDWARLEVYPHTSHNIITHVQYANLTWKTVDKDIDVAFRFDVPISNGKIWKKSGDDWIPVSMYLTQYNGKYYYRHDNFHVVQDGFYQFKWQYSLPVNTSGKWELLAKLSSDTIQEAYSSGRYVMLDPWWNSSWGHYRLLTISNTYIPADLTNFPVLVNVSAAISAKCDGGDSIRFISIVDNTTEYYYEIEGTWDNSSYNIVWVNITSVSSNADTEFLLYYNNTDATDNQSVTNVWDSNYLAVYHLNNFSDSTSNNYDLTATNSPTASTGKIGGCYDFEKDDSEYANNTAFYDLSTLTGCTIELWGKTDTNVEGGIYLGEGLTDDEHTFAWTVHVDEKFQGYLRNSSDYIIARTSIVYSTTSIWRYHAVTFTNDDVYCYVNRNETAHNTATSGNVGLNNITVDELHVARDGDSVKYYDGFIDELRISKVVRNASWLSATYNSTNQTPGFLTVGTESGSVQVNATTGIELTNATLNGYASDIFGGNFDCGFWIGRTTPVTGANADQNVTCSYTITEGENFSYNVLSLLEGTHYYVKAWIANSYWKNSSNEDNFYTKCTVPSGFTATLSGCNVDLAWTRGVGAVNTAVVRKADSYPTSPTDGTVVYNSTASSYSDTTAGGDHQYYRAWSWAGDKHSDSYSSDNEIVPPCPPTSVAGEILVNNTLKISWTKGAGADTTVVIRKADSSPTTVTDGTVMYNSTGTSYVATNLTENYFYRLWSYANGTYSTSVALDFGALVINCYSEETNSSLYFDVFVSNQSGSQTYESRNNTNPLVINVEDNLPIDDKVSIRVSAASNYSAKTETFTYQFTENGTVTYVVLLQEPESKALTNVTCKNTTSWGDSYPAFTLSADVITILADAADEFDRITVNYTHYEYVSRTYYRDLTTNHVFLLNAYLPSTANKILCRITVINELSQSVDDAYVEIQRNINSGWTTIASRYTDGNGQVDVFLVDGMLYKFIISKTNYVTEYADWTPSSEVPIHTFKLYFEEVEPIPPYVEPEEITFNGYISGTTLYVNYSDNLEGTIDTQIFIYEINITTGIETLFGSDSKTGNDSFQVSFTNINTSNTYKAILHYNHTTFGFNLTKTLIFEGTYIPTTTPGKITSLLDALVGPSIFGWGNFLIWLFLVAGCYYTDQRDAGKILVLLGGLFLFLNVVIGFNTTLITLAGGAVPVLFIVVGIIVMWNDSRKVAI